METRDSMETGAGSRASLHWKNLYEAAVLELDRNKMLQRIAQAERAVAERLEVATKSGNAEAETLTNALIVLRDLRKMASSDGHGQE